VLGPHLLKTLSNNRNLNLIEGIGLFTQAVMKQVVDGQESMVTLLKTLHKSPILAANLCHFLRNTTPENKRNQFDAMYECAIHKLSNRRPNTPY
jgi:hypothetical protein